MTTLLNYIVLGDPGLNDRALNYGDGCFTTIRCCRGQAELLNLHASRLFKDATRLSLFSHVDEPSIADFESLVNHAASASQAYKEKDIYVTKILLSRGKGGRGYAPDNTSGPTIFISHHDFPFSLRSSINIGVSDVALSQQPLLAGIKHLNRLEQVLAKLHLQSQKSWDDALVLDRQDRVIELTAANVFFKVNEVWYTPILDESGVSGVMRECVLRHFNDHKVAYEIGTYHLSFLTKASAVFSCNALSHLRVIKSLECRDSIIEFDTIETERLSATIDNIIKLELEKQLKEHS
jgi:4-amino-4-deoxychorismate lyase